MAKSRKPDILVPIDTLASDDYRKALNIVESFPIQVKIYFIKTRDEAIENLERFLADI